MSGSRLPVLAALLAGCVLLVVAGIYVAEPAHGLPAFFPGHAGTGSEAGHHHIKHGLAVVAVALVAFAFAWFATGPAGRRHES